MGEKEDEDEDRKRQGQRQIWLCAQVKYVLKSAMYDWYSRSSVLLLISHMTKRGIRS